MKMIKRMFQLNLSAKEVVMAKRILAVMMMPILMFYMTSVNILLMGMMKAQAADGSGHMTIDKDTVTAGGTQTYRLTFDPTEAMDGGLVKVIVPNGWTAPAGGNTALTSVSGATFDSLSFSGQEIIVPITSMASNQGFYLTLTNFVAPTSADDYTFTTKSKLSGGSYREIGDSPIVTVQPGAVDHYTFSAIDSQTVGVNFTTTVTAVDVSGNLTTLGGNVGIDVKTGTGSLIGETTADTSSDGTDTITIKYNKVENGIVLRADSDDNSLSNSFNVTNLTAPTFSSPFSSTNDSTPTINWSDVSGTGIEYVMKLKARTGGDCTTEDYSSPLLDKNTAGTSQYQVISAEALTDEAIYCVKVTATDDYSNSVTAYKTFNLLTSKPATPSALIELSGSVDTFGHPANKINIYNNESVDVKVTHTSNLDEGTAYVEISDGLGNTVTGNETISGAGTTSTIVSGIDASSLQQGTVTIKARVEDAGTNSSDWSAGTSATKDTSSPVKPTAVSFVDDPINTSNKTAVNLSVDGESGSTAYYEISDAGSVHTVSGNFSMTSSSVLGPDINLSTLNDGTVTASVYLVDSAWNRSSAKTGTVTKDATAPDVHAGLDKIVNARFSQDASATDATSGIASYQWSVVSGPEEGIATLETPNAEDTHISADTEGTYVIRLTVTDNAGNSASDEMTLIWDTTDPTITISALAPDPSNDNTPTLTGNVQDTATNIVSVEYEIDESDTWIAASATDGAFDEADENYTLTTAALLDGDHTITVRATDAAGNTIHAANYQSTSFTIDTAGPTLSFTDNVAAGPAQSDTISPSWGDATVMKWKYNVGNTCPDTAGDYSKTNADSMNQADATNNGKYICLYAEDALGNKSILASANDINIDITAPTITITNPAAAPAAKTRTITASMDEAGSLYFAVNEAGNNTCGSGLIFAAYDSITFSAETDNGKKVCYKAEDTAGNTSYALSNAIAGIDTHAPTLDSFSSSTTAGTYGPGSNINITANYNEGIGAGSTLTVVLNNGASIVLNNVSGTTIYGTYNVGVTGSGEGITNLKVASIFAQNVNDIAGNNLTTTGGYAGTNISDGINVDVTAPAASLSGTPANPTNVTSINVTVGGDGVVNYQYRLDGADPDAYSASTPIATHIIIAGPIAEGSHNLYVKGIDAYGNVQAAPATHTWTIDTTAPTISSVVVVPAVGYRKVGEAAIVTITAGGAQNNLTVGGTCTINGKDVSGTFHNNSNGTYQFIYSVAEGDTDRTSGTLPINCTLQEPAGNTVLVNALDANTLVIDANKPNAPAVTSIATDNKINDSEKATIHVVGTAEVGTTVNVTLADAGNAHTATNSGSTAAITGAYDITIDGTSLNDGTITPSVTATDAAGNVSDATTTPTATKDVVAPTAPTVTYTDPVNVGNKTNTTLTIEGETGTTYNYSIDDANAGTSAVTGTGMLDVSPKSITGIDVSGLTDGTVTASVTLTDAAGNVSGAGTDSATKDAVAPTVTSAKISVTGNNGTAANTFKKGDIVTVTWDNTGTGDNNADIASVTIDFSQFGGGAVVIATNNGSGSWSATYTLANDINLSGEKVSVTATDTHGNSTTTQDDTGYNVDTHNPVISRSAIKSGNGVLSGYIYQADTYYIYAQVDDGSGSLNSITANVSNVTALETAVALSAVGGPWTIDGQTYNYRSAQKTADNPLTEGTKAYTVDANDIAGNNATQFSGSVLSDKSVPNDPTMTFYDSSSKNSTLTTGTWYNYSSPYVEWGTPNDNPPSNSGIAGYYICVDEANTCDPNSSETNFQTSTNYTLSSLTTGHTYYVRVETKDNAGNVTSSGGALFTYKFDNTNPTSGNVTDDGDWTSSATTLHATWANFSDASGITLYQYSIGTTAGATDVKGWTGNGTTASVTDATLSLSTGNTYYINVRAYDEAGNVSSVASSNGITVDTQAPVGTLASVNNYSNTSFTVSWSAGTDVGLSGLNGHYKVKYKDQTDGVWTNWLNDATETSATFGAGDSPIALVSGHTYYFEASSQDNAGNWEAFVGGSGEDAIIYDTTAPNNPTVNGYQTSGKTVSLPTNNWYNYSNPYFEWSAPQDLPTDAGLGNSGIQGYYVYFGTNSGADPVASGAWQTSANYTVGTSMTSGQTYYLIVKTKDNANNVSGASTVFIYKYDTNAPDNVSVPVSGWSDSGKTVAITNGSWYNYTNPHFEWTTPNDNPGGNNAGVREYYKGQSTSATYDPSGNLNSNLYYTFNTLSDFNTYYLRMKVVDNADLNATGSPVGNVSSPITAFTYHFDNVAPTTSVTTVSPIYDSTSDYIKGDVTISGTAADTGGSGVGKTDVQIKDTSDSKYWNGAAWQAGEAWINTGATTTWSYTTSGLDLAGRDGHTFEIKSKAYDSVNGGGTNGNSGTSSVYSVIVDTTAAALGANTSDIAATTGDTFNFRQAATDAGSGISYVKAEYWFGAGAHTETAMTYDAGSGKYLLSISIPSGSTDALHYMFKTRDNVGNTETTSLQTDQTVTDNDSPVVNVTTEDTSATAGGTVHLHTDVTDNIGVSSVTLHYKNSGGSWHTTSMDHDSGNVYHATIDVQQSTSGDMEYFVTAKDAANNEGNDGGEDDAYTIDVVAGSLDHFEVYSDTDPVVAGSSFIATIIAKDQYGNNKSNSVTADITVQGYSGGSYRSLTNYSVNPSSISFTNNAVKSATITINGTGLTSISQIKIIASSGSVNGSTQIGITGFNATVAGTESDGGNEMIQGEEAAPAPVVEGAEGQSMQIVGQPWYSWRNLAAMGVLTFLIFIFIKWLLMRISGGAGSQGFKGFLFSSLKTAASRARMFLW